MNAAWKLGYQDATGPEKVNHKMSRKYQITTPYGNVFYVHENANMERADTPGIQSDSWKFIGLEGVNSFRNFINFDSLDSWLATKPELLFKNGNPRYTVRDNDHGTFNSWGNTRRNGVKSILICDSPFDPAGKQ